MKNNYECFKQSIQYISKLSKLSFLHHYCSGDTPCFHTSPCTKSKSTAFAPKLNIHDNLHDGKVIAEEKKTRKD